MSMKHLAAVAFALVGLSGTPAHSQQALTARIIGTCGTLSPFPALHPGAVGQLYMDVTGTLCSVGGGGGGGGGTSSNFGAAFPGAGTAAGAEYLTSAPTLSNGEMVALQTDINGNLKVNVISGGGSNASVGQTGLTAPASATYSGMLVASGNMVGVSGSVWGSAPTGLNVLGANVDVLSSVLPTGAATSALQTTGNTALGTIIATLGSPMQNSGGSVTVNQATAANLNMTCANCSGSGVSAADNAAFTAGTTQQALGGAVATAAPAAWGGTTGHQGAVGMSLNREQWVDVGTSSNLFGAVSAGTGTNGSAAPANAVMVGGYDGTLFRNLLTSTSGHMIIDCNSAGGSCGSSGGTSSSFGSAFPSIGTAAGAEYLSAAPTLSNGQMVALQTTVNGSLHTTADNVNSNGSATSANSSPVVIASDQAPVATKAAASAFASGALVDIFNLTGTKNGGTAASNSLLAGGVYNSSPLTLTTGQQSSLQLDANGYLAVNIKAGAGGGGTSSNFGSTFPTAGTAAGAEYLTSAPTLSNGQMVALQTTINGSLHTTVDNTNPNGSAVSGSSSPVVIASDQAPVAVKAASGAIAANSIAAGASAGDPCTFGTKITLPISTANTALTSIVGISASTKIYVCSLVLVAPGATAFSLIRGTGTNCSTGSPSAIFGSTTAANGMSFAANGGITVGNGAGVVGATNAADMLCTLQSNAVQVAGNLTYVQQ